MQLTTGNLRKGFLLKIFDEKGNTGEGDVAPLPNWSTESLEDCFREFEQKKEKILAITWTNASCLHDLATLSLLPSLSFGLESALLTLLDPLKTRPISKSALFMGSPDEILKQADLRKKEGYTTAKLKVSNLTFRDAEVLITHLSPSFRLRIDVNRAWSKADSLSFFSQFPLDLFDYVEEPFASPHDLPLFTHPLAVDESFPHDLSLKDLETLPTLKALIYKPTIQGGLLHALPLHQWTKKKAISLILSSSFESNIGLTHIASMAQRLHIIVPIGVGTSHFIQSFAAQLTYNQ